MYSKEIEELLRKNNNVISFEQYYQAFNPEITTQIKIMSYDSSKDSLYVLTTDDYLFCFQLEQRPEQNKKIKK